MSRWWAAPASNWWVAPALLVLIVILFYWKLTLTDQYTWMESPDLAYQVLPWFQFQAGEWHHTRFPLWDPNGYAGQTLFGQAQPGAAYPLNWLLFLMPFHAGAISQRVLDWYFVLIRALAAVNCFGLCRSLGRSRGASILGGCVFALGGYIANMKWPQKVNGVVWAPLALLFLLRAIRGEKPWASALASGFFLGVTWLGGHHEAPLFLTLAAIAIWAWSKQLRLGAVSLMVAGLASAFQTLPMLEYGSRAVRWVGSPNDPLSAGQTVPYTVHAQFALNPLNLLGVILPQLDDDPSNPFVGVVALSLGMLGAILAWRERQVRWLVALALGGIVFALGGNSVFHGVLYALVPFLDKARSPSAATLLFALGLAPLAACGVDALAEASSMAWSRRAGRVLGWAGVALAAVSLGFFLIHAEPAISDNRMMITALCALLAAALLAAWRAGVLSSRAGVALALGLILVELSNVSTYWLPHKSLEARNVYLKRLTEHTDIAGFLRRASGDQDSRIEYDDLAIPYNFGDWFGLDTFTTYAASMPANLWRLDLFSPRGRDFFGIRYSLAKASNREGQREVFQGASGVKVFENPGAYPRVWAVHEAIVLPPGTSARDALNSPQFDPRRTVFFERGSPPDSSPPKLESCNAAGDAVQMPMHRANLVRITAHLGCRGMVILTDAWFPGWRVSVDGRSAEIEEADGAVRGVTVEAGDHVIEMRYRPWSVILGGAMALLAAGLGLLGIFPGKILGIFVHSSAEGGVHPGG